MLAYTKPEQKQNSKSAVQRKEPKQAASSPNLTGIPDSTKTQFENLSGFSFDDVRVHYNSDKPAQLQALAYTQGNQVYVASGQERHLGHELGHVVQQKQGIVTATATVNGVAVNDNVSLEKEADNFGQKATGSLIQMQTEKPWSKLLQMKSKDNGIVQKWAGDIKNKYSDSDFQDATRRDVIIYQLFDVATEGRGFFYVGKTNQPLESRLKQHKDAFGRDDIRIAPLIKGSYTPFETATYEQGCIGVAKQISGLQNRINALDVDKWRWFSAPGHEVNRYQNIFLDDSQHWL